MAIVVVRYGSITERCLNAAKTKSNMIKLTEQKPKKRGRPRQQKLAKALIENVAKDKPLPIGQVLESVGYPHSTATTYPGDVINQKGVQNELAILGFSEETAKKVVGDILGKESAQDKDRLKAADMVFDVFGTKAPLKSVTVQVNIENHALLKQAALKVIEEMKHGEE